MRGSPQEWSLVFYLHFNHKTDLTFLSKTFTIKVRSLCVVLMISPLVVRRTFYLIVNDRDLALKIRLLFSIAIQLLVVDYIKNIYPLVYNGSLYRKTMLSRQKDFVRVSIPKLYHVGKLVDDISYPLLGLFK